MTGGPAVIAPEQETRQDPGWHRGLDEPNLNVPDGKITRPVVTGPAKPEGGKAMSNLDEAVA